MIRETFNGATITIYGEPSKPDTLVLPKPTPEEVLETKIVEITHKLDMQSSILMQIGMLAAKPPDIPDTLPDPKDLPAGETPLPDADTLKGLMSGATPPEIPS